MEQSHKLSLKVLRLSKSVLAKQADILTEDQQLKSFVTTLPAPLLTLPASFGTIFAGESFRFIVSVNIANEADDTSYESWLNCVAQTPSNRSITLVKATETNFLIGSASKRTKEFIVTHEAREIGAYTLTVEVNYRKNGHSIDGDVEEFKNNRGFKKIYKFNTAPGITVKAKFLSVGGSSSNCLVQAQVENLTGSTLVLETLQLDPPEGWQLVLGPSSSEYSSSPINPKDVLQYIYMLIAEKSESHDHLSDTRFTVSWRREPMGEKGWLTINHLK